MFFYECILVLQLFSLARRLSPHGATQTPNEESNEKRISNLHSNTGDVGVVYDEISEPMRQQRNTGTTGTANIQLKENAAYQTTGLESARQERNSGIYI